MRVQWNRTVRRYGSAPWRAVVTHGGPGAPGSAAPLAKVLGKSMGTLEPMQTRFTIASALAELREQITENAAFPVALIGHSWGAWLALLLAAGHPELVDRLVLVGSGPLDPFYAPAIHRRREAKLTADQQARFAAALAALCAEDEQETAKQAAKETLRAITTITDNHRLIAEKETDTEPEAPFDAEQYAAIWKEAEQLRKEGGLMAAARKIICPVAVLHGEDDPHPAEGVARPLEQAGTHPRVTIFPQCGHAPFMEKFARGAFFDKLLAFLREEK